MSYPSYTVTSQAAPLGAYPSAYPAAAAAPYPMTSYAAAPGAAPAPFYGGSYAPAAAPIAGAPVTSGIAAVRSGVSVPVGPAAATAASYYGGAYPYAGAPGAFPAGPSPYGPAGSYYGHPGSRNVEPASRGRPGYNRGYFYDDYIHDRHSPRRSYARPRTMQDEFEGDIIYRQPITRDEDFVLPRRSPRAGATSSQAESSPAPAPVAAAPAPVDPTPAPVPGPVTIEVVEAKELPTSILDKVDPYVIVKVGGQEIRTKYKDDSGKAARWNESFTLDGLRAGAEGTIEVKDKDTIKDDSIGTTNFFLENGDRWYPLKPKGQVRLVVRGAY